MIKAQTLSTDFVIANPQAPFNPFLMPRSDLHVNTFFIVKMNSRCSYRTAYHEGVPMALMIHSISSAPFICENHIQRRLAPQIVIINFTFAGKGVF